MLRHSILELDSKTIHRWSKYPYDFILARRSAKLAASTIAASGQQPAFTKFNDVYLTPVLSVASWLVTVACHNKRADHSGLQ